MCLLLCNVLCARCTSALIESLKRCADTKLRENMSRLLPFEVKLAKNCSRRVLNSIIHQKYNISFNSTDVFNTNA